MKALTFADQLQNVGLLLAVLVVVVAIIIAAIALIDKLVMRKTSFEALLSRPDMASIGVGLFLGGLAFGLCVIGSRAVGAPLDRYDDDFRIQSRLVFGYSQDWRWFKAQGMTESKLDPLVCSQVGACGVMQFMPGTAVGMGLTDRFNARDSIRAGIRYDRQLFDLFSAPRPPEDRLAFMFAGYNWGAGNVIRIAQPCALKRSGSDALWEHVAPCVPQETRDYWPRIAQWRARFSVNG